MVLKYILKNFTRRKVRTILMILALTVSIGLIVTMSATVETVRQSNVDLIASAVGRFDLAVSKRDTSSDSFMPIAKVSQTILAADARITAVHPRIESSVELSANGNDGRGSLIALDPRVDDVGYIDVVEGQYALGEGQAALLEDSAHSLGLDVGDSIDVSYRFPSPREMGQPEATGSSERRTAHRFTIVAIVRQDGVTSGGQDGLIVRLADVQAWLDLPDRAQSLMATVDPALYETSNAEVAALRVRDVVRAVQGVLGDEYEYRMEKAATLSEVAQAFLLVQALINTYGLVSLGVVGLLVHTLVLTNVQEQRRDMAILRILGSLRRVLFALVIAEVIVIGVIGLSLGIGLGQILTRFVVVPLIQQQMAQEGITSPLTPHLSLTTLLPVIASAFFVLILSSLKPAREAARTKVVHAINPGVADNIQLEDLAQLRERRPDLRMFLAGLALMLIFVLVAGFQVSQSFGSPALEAIFILLALGLLILGLGLMFFILTVPFEKLVLLLMGFVVPRLTFFAKRNVGRGQTRNTLIALLVLFSGVLPSFLATQMALEDANFEANTRQSMGAPVDMRVFGNWPTLEEASRYRLSTRFRTQELKTVAGVDQSVGLTFGYRADVSDAVDFRSASFTVYGVDGRLTDVLFIDLVDFVAGDLGALDTLQDDPEAIIISEGLADHLAVSLGDTIKVKGEGADHVLNAHIIAIARKIPGIGGFSRSRTAADYNSEALISLDSFRALIMPLDQPPFPADKGVLSRIMMTLSPDANVRDIADEMGQRFSRERPVWTRFLEISIEESRRSQATQRIFLLVMTSISFTTAVFGVFAVIYVNIYARRIEIGMLKAIGMKRRYLSGMLIVESITMTLGAALAGITAGATMSYIAFYGQQTLTQRPAIFAVDTTVAPFIAVMVVLASVLGATFSARRIVKKQAVEILRM